MVLELFVAKRGEICSNSNIPVQILEVLEESYFLFCQLLFFIGELLWVRYLALTEDEQPSTV